eukprot:10015680-Lingulodinium_polyedra.AAC.1
MLRGDWSQDRPHRAPCRAVSQVISFVAVSLPGVGTIPRSMERNLHSSVVLVEFVLSVSIAGPQHHASQE